MKIYANEAIPVRLERWISFRHENEHSEIPTTVAFKQLRQHASRHRCRIDEKHAAERAVARQRRDWSKSSRDFPTEQKSPEDKGMNFLYNGRIETSNHLTLFIHQIKFFILQQKSSSLLARNEKFVFWSRKYVIIIITLGSTPKTAFRNANPSPENIFSHNRAASNLQSVTRTFVPKKKSKTKTPLFYGEKSKAASVPGGGRALGWTSWHGRLMIDSRLKRPAPWDYFQSGPRRKKRTSPSLITLDAHALGMRWREGVVRSLIWRQSRVAPVAAWWGQQRSARTFRRSQARGGVPVRVSMCAKRQQKQAAPPGRSQLTLQMSFWVSWLKVTTGLLFIFYFSLSLCLLVI